MNLKQGLDYRLAQRGFFGKGLYVTSNPMKANDYSPDKGQPTALRMMLRCRVLLGKAKEFDVGRFDRDLTIEPEGFDSVQGFIRRGIEYVLYANDRVYITHVIFYRFGDRDLELAPSFALPPNVTGQIVYITASLSEFFGKLQQRATVDQQIPIKRLISALLKRAITVTQFLDQISSMLKALPPKDLCEKLTTELEKCKLSPSASNVSVSSTANSGTNSAEDPTLGSSRSLKADLSTTIIGSRPSDILGAGSTAALDTGLNGVSSNNPSQIMAGDEAVVSNGMVANGIGSSLFPGAFSTSSESESAMLPIHHLIHQPTVPPLLAGAGQSRSASIIPHTPIDNSGASGTWSGLSAHTGGVNDGYFPNAKITSAEADGTYTQANAPTSVSLFPVLTPLSNITTTMNVISSSPAKSINTAMLSSIATSFSSSPISSAVNVPDPITSSSVINVSKACHPAGSCSTGSLTSDDHKIRKDDTTERSDRPGTFSNTLTSAIDEVATNVDSGNNRSALASSCDGPARIVRNIGQNGTDASSASNFGFTGANDDKHNAISSLDTDLERPSAATTTPADHTITTQVDSSLLKVFFFIILEQTK